jgi:CDP-paratose 2-epimerase
MKCVVTGEPYTVFGYKGKQVRDNIHSYDLITAFDHFFRAPRVAEVYNMGGSRFSHCSMLEAIALCEEIAGKKLQWQYAETNRIGDHIWWVSDVRKFQRHYPGWSFRYGLQEILLEIFEHNKSRWTRG